MKKEYLSLTALLWGALILAPSMARGVTITDACVLEESGDGCIFDIQATAAGTLAVDTKAEATGEYWRTTVVKLNTVGAMSKLGTGSASAFTGKVSRSIVAGTNYIAIVSYEHPLPGTFPTSVGVRFTGPVVVTHRPISEQCPISPGIVTDNFNSYADGNLTGKNDGTGWAGAWSGDTAFQVQGTTVQEGAKAVSCTPGTSGAGKTISRSFSTGVTAGTISFDVRKTHTGDGGGALEFQILEGATFRGRIQFNDGENGKLELLGVSPEVLVPSYITNQWYHCEIQFDTSTDQVRARVNGGNWTGWISFVGAVDATVIDGIRMVSVPNTSNPTDYFDNIQ